MMEEELMTVDNRNIIKNSDTSSILSHENSINEEMIQKVCLQSQNVNSLVETICLKENSSKSNISEYLSVQCEFCGKRYKDYKRLKGHFEFCHPKVYYKCNVCPEQFSKKWLLNTHMRKHTGESPYSCLYCDQKFVSNNKLQIHSNFHHKEKNLFCEICNAFGFYTKQDLGNHIRTKHTKERVFHCEICSKSFMSSSVYYQHRNIHTSIKKYSCDVCSKTFRRWMTLHNHLKIHTNERPYSCDVCKQTFRQKGDVKKHKINQHSNLKM